MQPIDAVILFFWLMFGHALADYPLQGDFLSGMKRRANKIAGEAMWVWGLMMHGCVHAGFVFAFTGSPLLAVLEFFAHMMIDFAKCEGKISFKMNQALHVACKIAWVALIYTGRVHGR